MREVDDLRALLLRKQVTVYEAARLIAGGAGRTQDFVALIIEAIEGGALTAQQVVRWHVPDYENGDYEGSINDMQATLLREDLDQWCRGLGIAIPSGVSTTTPETPDVLTPSDKRGKRPANEATAPHADASQLEDGTGENDDWQSKARQTADKIALNKWNRGERQITARNISEAVASELGKDEGNWGKQGPRSESNVRNEGLRGWKFHPPQDLD